MTNANEPTLHPLQREWVGLSKTQQDFIYRNLFHSTLPRKDSFWVDFANAIEAELRSKNT